MKERSIELVCNVLKSKKEREEKKLRCYKSKVTVVNSNNLNQMLLVLRKSHRVKCLAEWLLPSRRVSVLTFSEDFMRLSPWLPFSLIDFSLHVLVSLFVVSSLSLSLSLILPTITICVCFVYVRVAFYSSSNLSLLLLSSSSCF